MNQDNINAVLDRHDISADDNDANRDPLTGARGAHPVGTGIGALVGGVAGGAATAAVGGGCSDG